MESRPPQKSLQAALHGIEGVAVVADDVAVAVVADDVMVIGGGKTDEEARQRHDESLVQLFMRARKSNIKYNKEKRTSYVRAAVHWSPDFKQSLTAALHLYQPLVLHSHKVSLLNSLQLTGVVLQVCIAMIPCRARFSSVTAGNSVVGSLDSTSAITCCSPGR